MTLELLPRDYQDASLDGLAEGVRAGHKRQVLAAPTGSGKSICALQLLKRAMAKHSKAVFIVDRVSLLDQTSALLDAYGFEHGCLQGSHWRFRPWEPIQVASAQTLARRDIDIDWQLIIVDEAHIRHASTIQIIEAHPNAVVIALTATPFSKSMGRTYTNVVNVTTTNKLVEQGWLAPIKFYVARTLDMTGAAIKTDGEWKDSEIEERGIKIIGDVVEEWKAKTLEHFGGTAKTIAFTATVAHGEELCRQFQAAGFNFQQISYKDHGDEGRRAKIEEFRKADTEIDGLVSCEALSRGFDVPDILVGLGCKPYRKSFSGHIQQIGRVMRASPGKQYGIWLDHASNLVRFAQDTADLFENGVSSLASELDSTVRKEPTEKERTALQCGQCHHAMTFKMTHCPSCGWERPKRQNGVENVAGSLHEISLGTKAEKRAAYLEDKEAVWRQIVGYALDLKRGDAQSAEKLALATYKNLFNQWPRYAMRNITPEPCGAKLAGKLLSMRIAYAKAMKRKSA